MVHHLYYGPSVGESDLRGVEYYSDCGFSPQPAGMDRQRDYSLDTLCQEYTGSGVGDFRIGCLRLSGPDGSRAADFRFVSAEAVPGKYSLPGLPAAYAAEGECETLRLKLRDSVNGLAVTLLYGVFEAADVITASALFENEGEGDHPAGQGRFGLPGPALRPVGADPFPGPPLHGAPARACAPGPQRPDFAVGPGRFQPPAQPFAILAAPHTTEEAGECLGAMLVWSGSFKIECEVSQMQSTGWWPASATTISAGLWSRAASLAAPEVLFSYSDAGLSELSGPLPTTFCSTTSSAASGGTSPGPSSSTTGKPLIWTSTASASWTLR